MRLLVTQNTGGDWICENIAASHRAAAARWDAHYLQLTPRSRDVFWQKTIFCAQYVGAHRCCWVDGDAAIRSDCPSLFDLVPLDCFGGVLNYQPDTHDGEFDKWHGPTISAFQTLVNVPCGATDYLNVGVFVWSPDLHRHLWQRVVKFAGPRLLPMAEQTLLNLLLIESGTKVHHLPATYNRIGPEAWNVNQTAMIAHLARYKCHTTRIRLCDRVKLMKRIRWRVEDHKEAAA